MLPCPEYCVFSSSESGFSVKRIEEGKDRGSIKQSLRKIKHQGEEIARQKKANQFLKGIFLDFISLYF